MARRNKLMKFAEMRSFPNVYQNFDPKDPKLLGLNDEYYQLKGNWSKQHFENDHPITLELGCGRGEYSLALAKMFPERNFIGVDIKGARIWKGATIAMENGLNNIAFLRTKIEQIQLFFDTNEVDEIWITFPDPFTAKENRRLTAPVFLDRYRQFLKQGHAVHLKTDAISLYDYTKEILAERSDITIEEDNPDIYVKEVSEILNVKTYYEKMWLAEGKKITYLRFILK